MAEKIEPAPAPKVAHCPKQPMFRRSYEWVAVRTIRLSSTQTIEPGEDIPEETRLLLLITWHKRRQIGPKGHPWTEWMIEHAELMRDLRAARAKADKDALRGVKPAEEQPLEPKGEGESEEPLAEGESLEGEGEPETEEEPAEEELEPLAEGESLEGMFHVEHSSEQAEPPAPAPAKRKGRRGKGP